MNVICYDFLEPSHCQFAHSSLEDASKMTALGTIRYRQSAINNFFALTSRPSLNTAHTQLYAVRPHGADEYCRLALSLLMSDCIPYTASSRQTDQSHLRHLVDRHSQTSLVPCHSRVDTHRRLTAHLSVWHHLLPGALSKLFFDCTLGASPILVLHALATRRLPSRTQLLSHGVLQTATLALSVSRHLNPQDLFDDRTVSQ